MMTDDAASTGAENAVMAGIVPGDFTDGDTLQGARRPRGAGRSRHHLCAALPQFWPPHRNADRYAVSTLRARRRRVADGLDALQHERRGRRRLHRPRRRRRRDRRGDADLSRPRADREARTRASEGRAFAHEDLRAAIMQGAVERARPKMMTVTAIIAGLLPIPWSHGTGSELMQRIAVPMIGDMVSSTVLTLIVIPAVYGLIKGWGLERVRQQLPAPITRPAE